nr:YkvA family protein [Aeromonas veronii]
MSRKRWLIWQRLRRLYQGFRHPGTPWWARGLVILILLYGISPVDLIPDVVPLLGWFDDVTLLLVLLWGWERCLPPRSAQRSGTGLLVHLFNNILGFSLCAPTLEGSGKTVSFEGGHCGTKKRLPR